MSVSKLGLGGKLYFCVCKKKKHKHPMKSLIVFLIAVVLLTSCGMETVHCHSYGQTNNNTKHGKKLQARYTSKHRI